MGDWASSIRVAEDTGELFDFPDAGQLIHAVLAGDLDTAAPTSSTCHTPTRSCRGTEITEDIDIPMTIPPGAPMPRIRPPHDGNLDWLLQLGEVFRTESEIETIDGLPMLYVQTWYIHHDRLHRCEHPRPVRLDSAAIGWIDELRFAWRDVLDPRAPFSIHVEAPRPPLSIAF